MLLLFPSALTQNNAAELKKAAREHFPGIKSSHLSEAIASGFGYQSHAALLAALRSNARKRSNFSLIGFGKRLTELGYERLADFQVDQDVSWTSQCLMFLMIEAGYRDSVASEGSRITIPKAIESLDAAGCAAFANGQGLRARHQQAQVFRSVLSDMVEVQISVRDGDRLMMSPIIQKVEMDLGSGSIVFSLSDIVVRAARLAA